MSVIMASLRSLCPRRIASAAREAKYWTVLACLAGAYSSASAQQAAPLPVEAVVDSHTLEYTTPARFSLDGELLAYTVNPRSKDYRSGKYLPREMFNATGIGPTYVGQQIYIADTETGESRNLTGDKATNWGPLWSPDGRYLVFLSDRDGSGQAKLWVWDRSKEELRKAWDTPVRCFEVQWLPGTTKLLLMTASQNPALPDREGDKPSNPTEQGTKTAGSTVAVYESIQSAGSPAADPWKLKDSYPLRNMVLFDITTGKAQLVGKEHPIAQTFLSPDGSFVAFTSPTHFEKPGSQQTLFDIGLVRIKDGQERVLAHDVRLYLSGGDLSWSLDSLSLVYQTGGMEGNGDCHVIDLQTGSSRNITRFSQTPGYYPRGAPLWDPRGREIYWITDGAIWKANVADGKAEQTTKLTDDRFGYLVPQRENLLYSPDRGKSALAMARNGETKKSAFYKVDLETGKATKTYETGQCFDCLRLTEVSAVSTNGSQMAFLAGDAQHDFNWWITDENFKSPRRLTKINPQFDEYLMGAARLVEWMSLDGVKLRGALLLPSDYRQGTRYPLVVKVYGGWNGSEHFGSFGLETGITNFQLLATRGYAVLFPDAPQRLGTPMADLAKTVLPGVNKVIEMGIADPDRVGITGHSYGGYTTLSLLVQTNRFRAAVESAGMADLPAHYGEVAEDGASYGTAVLEGGQGLMGGPPWEFRERYLENSPIFYLDRVVTPLLILHGAKDSVVDAFLGGEIFVGLRRLGKTVEFARYGGEDHDMNLWSRANQIDFCNRTLHWFDVYLKGASK
jgi:dipeptidyl aminopeptidase/acylaminoacyl peptidase